MEGMSRTYDINTDSTLRTSAQWQDCLFPGTIILEASGWNRNEIVYSFYDEYITEEEFRNRWNNSIVQYTVD